MKIYSAKISEFSENEYNNAFSSMSEERKSAVLRKKFENDRKASVLGEALARKAICESLGIAERDIEFGRTENGKPFCRNGDIHFSISHSKDMVICALNNAPIGVDIEFIRPIDFRITKFACSLQEEEFLAEATDENEKQERFFKLWTAKEAFIKFHGLVLADIKDISYEEIKNRCDIYTFDGYIATVYREN